VRIISGKYKGRIIKAPGSLPARPTTDFAKTAIFNMLGNNFDMEDIIVLDLFAGLGSITYEFASRGAKSVTTVDLNFNSIRFIRETCDKLGISSVRAIKYDAFKFLKGVTEKYDVIFADPPYDMEESKTLPELVFNNDVLKSGGWFIFEHSEERDYSAFPSFKEKRNYGKVGFSIFQKEN
jgi:16S rRNA (guanine966-N2)-methyltransferase